MKRQSRRRFLKAGLVGGAVGGYGVMAQAGLLPKLGPTPSEIEGPFYPITPQKDKDFDLTRIEGRKGRAKGQIIWVEGRVLDTAGEPIEDASVDIWQANASGKYRHPHDPNPAPLDPNFQGWAIVPSGTNGWFRFKTISPGAYPASVTWDRPPHIHFKVTKRGYVELITQMYFPGHRLNDTDRLLMRKGPEERKLMIAERVKEDPETYSYRIMLQKA